MIVQKNAEDLMGRENNPRGSDEAHAKKEVILTIKTRKLFYMGHVMRRENYRRLQVII